MLAAWSPFWRPDTHQTLALGVDTAFDLVQWHPSESLSEETRSQPILEPSIPIYPNRYRFCLLHPSTVQGTQWRSVSRSPRRPWDRRRAVPMATGHKSSNTRGSMIPRIVQMEAHISQWERQQLLSNRKSFRLHLYISYTSTFACYWTSQSRSLTAEQYARRPEHTASHLMVHNQRKLRHVAIFRVLESPSVCPSNSIPRGL